MKKKQNALKHEIQSVTQYSYQHKFDISLQL